MRLSNWLERLTSSVSLPIGRRNRRRRSTSSKAVPGLHRRHRSGTASPLTENLESRCLLTTLTGAHATVGIQDADGSFISLGPFQGVVFGSGRDFFTPGDPLSNFTIHATNSDGDEVQATNGAPFYGTDIPVTVTDTSAGSVHSVSVTGVVNSTLLPDFELTRTISFDDTESTADRVVITVRNELSNTGEDTVEEVLFLESFDPDQDLTTFATLNDIVFDGKLATATAPTNPAGLTFAIGVRDADAILSVEDDFNVTDPSIVIDSPNDPNGTTADDSINVAYDFGDVDPDDTVVAEYTLIFATSLSEATTAYLDAGDDFGDAPDTYKTREASNGPRHDTSGPTLGPTRDGEPDAEVPLSGLGDDFGGIDDEDGVTLNGKFAAGGTGSVTVNASANAMLDAWIDFDNSGTFDADERLGPGGSIALTAGDNTISFTAPADTPEVLTNTYGRFRISTAGGLDVDGAAPDGEVEDHRVTISARPDCVVVDDDWASLTAGAAVDGGVFGFDRFAVIQTGISAVTTGGTVKVNPGTYSEAVNVPKHVILNGTSGVASDVIINPSGADGITITSDASTAVIRHLTVTNANDGINSATPGALTISNVVSDGQADDGLDVTASSFVNVSGGSFSNNTGDGIELTDVGTVILTDVTATGNDPGVFVSGAASFSDTDGTYTGNDDHGILLEDITGDVALTRTQADNNDADNDGTGDGLHARPDSNVDAIGGNLTILGGRFRDTDGSALVDHQERGVFVDGVNGVVLIDDASGPAESPEVTGNDSDGVHITNTGMVTIRDSNVSDNGEDGVALDSVGAVTLRRLTADNNGDDGVRIDDTSGGLALIRDSFVRGNSGDGIDLTNTGNVDVRLTDATVNTGTGLLIEDADTVRVRGGIASGIQTRDIGAFLTLSSDVSSTGPVDVEANNGITLNKGLDASDQSIRLAANLDGTGGQDFTQTADGFLRTTDSVVITVNAGLLSGTGDAKLGSITAGAVTGRITVRANQGEIVDQTPAETNLTAAEALLSALGGVGSTANPIDSAILRVEGTGGVEEFVLSNAGSLQIGGVDAGTVGVFGTQGVTITTASPLVVAEDVTSNGDVNLTATDGAAAGDDVTVKTTITVSAGGDANLSAGDNILLEDSSTVMAAGTVRLTADNPDADPGVGSTIDVFGTISSGSQAEITGGPDNDRIVINPGVGHTVDSTKIDGLGGGDLYRVFFGRLDSGGSAIEIRDTGTNGNDRGRFLGVTGLGETFNIANNAANGAPQTGGTVTSVNQNEVITYTQTLENFRVRGRGFNDTFNAQPSQTAEITVDGDGPSFGDPSVPPGDTLNFDPLGNTFVLDGKSILTNGGSPNPFLPLNFVDIETLPLTPLGTSEPISFDFDHSNTAASVATSPTQPGYVSVLRDTLYADGMGYGWQTAVKSFERDDGFYSGPFEAIVRDGNWFDEDSVFTIDLENGWYSVTVTLGNAYSSTSGGEIRNADTGDVLATDISSPPAVSTQVTVAALVTDGSLDLEFIADGVPPIFSVNAIAIRPANLLTMGLTLSAIGSLGADGVTVDTFRLHDAPANAYVTVATDLGTIVTEDADSEIDGIQVLTDGDGEADIDILRPSGRGEAVVTFTDVNGQGLGCSVLNYVLPDTRNFDYNDGRQVDEGVFIAASPTQAPVATGAFPGGFLGVLGTGLFSTAAGYGWLMTPGDFDDGALIAPLGDLLRDGVSSDAAHTFRVNLPEGDYDALVSLGGSQEHDGLDVDVNGTSVVSGVATMPGEHVQVPFSFSVPSNGLADFTFSDSAGAAFWAVNGLQIRPREDIVAFDFTPNVGDVPADAQTIATVKANTILADGKEVTVTTSAGTIITADANDIIDGVQVVAAGGMISFDVLAPETPATPTLTATSLDGVHNSTVTDASLLDFVLAPSRRFDFNHTYSADGPGPSITAAGFIGVLRTDTDPASGHGWIAPPNSFDAGVPNGDDDSLSNAFNVLTTDLYRDYHSGHALLGARTFRVQVDSALKYDGTLYIGSQNFDASTRVTIEGLGVVTTTNTMAKQFVTVGYVGAMDLGADGFIDITFEHGGSAATPLWATTGVDLVEQGQPLPLPSPVVAEDRQPGGFVDPVEQSEIDLAVEIAIAAWEDNGATPEEIALLESTPVLVRDFGRNGALGLATPLGQVVIDDDGSGFGWSPILDVPTGDRYDLVTVVAHEFGHILGRPDLEPVADTNELMAPYLQRGARHDSFEGTDGFFTNAVAEVLGSI